jgi:hypothetical protein
LRSFAAVLLSCAIQRVTFCHPKVLASEQVIKLVLRDARRRFDELINRNDIGRDPSVAAGVRVNRAEVLGQEQSPGEVGGIAMNKEHLAIAAIGKRLALNLRQDLAGVESVTAA